MSNDRCVPYYCGAVGCPNERDSDKIVCPACWDNVPPSLQAELFNTQQLKTPMIDGSWAPWARARAKCIASISFETAAQRQRYLDREFAFAERLENKTRDRDNKPKNSGTLLQ